MSRTRASVTLWLTGAAVFLGAWGQAVDSSGRAVATTFSWASSNPAQVGVQRR